MPVISAERFLSGGPIQEPTIDLDGGFFDQSNPADSTGPLVTAVKNQYNHLELILWDVTGDPWKRIRHFSSTETENVKDIALVVGGDGAVTAIRTKTDKLTVNVWDTWPPDVYTGPNATKATDDAVSLVSIGAMSYERFVTAVRNHEGNLRLAIWDYDSEAEPQSRLTKIEKGDFAAAGAISEVRVVTGLGVGTSDFGTDGFATVIRDGDGKLSVILWQVASDGSITRGPTGIGQRASKISAFPGPGSFGVTTAFRNHSGLLELNIWEASGSEFQKVAHKSSQDAVSEIAIVPVDRDFVATVVRLTADDHMKIILWKSSVNPTLIDQSVHALGDKCSQIAAYGSPIRATVNTGTGKAWVVTAARDSNLNLSIVGWKVSDYQ